MKITILKKLFLSSFIENNLKQNRSKYAIKKIPKDSKKRKCPIEKEQVKYNQFCRSKKKVQFQYYLEKYETQRQKQQHF